MVDVWQQYTPQSIGEGKFWLFDHSTRQQHKIWSGNDERLPSNMDVGVDRGGDRTVILQLHGPDHYTLFDFGQ